MAVSPMVPGCDRNPHPFSLAVSKQAIHYSHRASGGGVITDSAARNGWRKERTRREVGGHGWWVLEVECSPLGIESMANETIYTPMFDLQGKKWTLNNCRCLMQLIHNRSIAINVLIYGWRCLGMDVHALRGFQHQKGKLWLYVYSIQ